MAKPDKRSTEEAQQIARFASAKREKREDGPLSADYLADNRDDPLTIRDIIPLPTVITYTRSKQ
jgi:hypothetical protein